MEFFGITCYGPQNYIRDMMRDEYREPTKPEEVLPMLKNVELYSTYPKQFVRPDVNVIREIDCYIGRVNGFAYGSKERFNKMKIKRIVKPLGPCDMYRLPPITSFEYGWFYNDPILQESNWYKTIPRYPQPSSPNTLVLDRERRINKYASLF